MNSKVIKAIKEKYAEKLSSLPYTMRDRQARDLVRKECHKQKVKATFNEINSMAAIIVRYV